MKNALRVFAAVILFAMTFVEPASAGPDDLPFCAAPNIRSATSGATVVVLPSNNFVDVPGMSVTVLVSSVNIGVRCLVVSFSAQLARLGTSPSNQAVVRALLDGNVVGAPIEASTGGVRFSSGPVGEYHVNTFNFVFLDVPPGLHTVKMQIRVPPEYIEALFGPRSLVVHFG